MLLNTSKTVCLSITRSGEPITHLTLNGEIITEERVHRHLGLLIERDLKWREQTSDVVTRAEHRLAILRSFSRRFSRATLLKLYTIYIRPILEYADVVWANMTMGESDKLEEVNRAAMRIATGAKLGTSHRYLYEETGLQKLEERRYNHHIIMMYQVVHNTRKYQLGISDIQNVSDRNRYSVRSTNKLSAIKCRTTAYQNSFLPKGINIWNDANQTIKDCNDLESLKLLLRDKSKPNKLYNVSYTRCIHCFLVTG